MKGHFLQGICGEPTDLRPLELGIESAEGYTLKPIHEKLVEIYEMTPTEQTTLSLEYLHRVAAQAGRNGFALRTQSPFKAYHAALLRQSFSRDSEQHQANLQELARVLSNGKEDTIQRGMDREIEAKVAPEICAIFPLTARCNHSCEPNAQVQSQVFVDSHMDMVALRDLEAGEELLISYLPVGPGVGRKTAVQRRRELQAKYLFYCDCPKCTAGT